MHREEMRFAGLSNLTLSAVRLPGRGRLRLLLATSAFAVAGGLRLFQPGAALFWHDEVLTLLSASGYRFAEIRESLTSELEISAGQLADLRRYRPAGGVRATVEQLAEETPEHPPLYYLLLRWWMDLFGDETGTVRIFSALCGLACVAAVYFLGRGLFRSKLAGLYCLAFVGFSPLFVIYSREAREYALLTLLVTATFAALLGATRREPGAGAFSGPVRWWGLYVLLAVAGIYTSLMFIPGFLAHAAYILFLPGERRSRVLPGFLVSAGLILILSSPLIWALSQNYDTLLRSTEWTRLYRLPAGPLVQHASMNLARVFSVAGTEPAALWFLPGGLALALLCWSLIRVVRLAPGAGLALLLLLCFPMLVFLVLDLVFGGIRSLPTRFLFPSLLGFLLLVAGALARTDHFAAGVIAVMLFCLQLGSSLYAIRHDSPMAKSISLNVPRVARLVRSYPRARLHASLRGYDLANAVVLAGYLPPDRSVRFVRDRAREESEILSRDILIFARYCKRHPLAAAYRNRVEVLFMGRHVSLCRILQKGS